MVSMVNSLLMLSYFLLTCGGEEIIICEGQTSSIDCSSGMVINIVEAMYGRRALAYSNCNANYNISQSCVNNVDVSNTGCQLQRYCTLTPTNHGPYGSDPCPNKAKYLNMTYNCIPDTTSPQTTTLDVTTQQTSSEETTATHEASTMLINSAIGDCQCPCTKVGINQWNYLYELNLTRTEMKEVMQYYLDSLVQNVTIDRKATNRVYRMKTSAPDSRKSARSMGSVGVTVIATMTILLVATDALNIYNYATKK